MGTGCQDSDEEIERQPPGTESAPKGARRFSEKYSDDGNGRAAAHKAIKFTPRYGSPSGESDAVRCGLSSAPSRHCELMTGARGQGHADQLLAWSWALHNIMTS